MGKSIVRALAIVLALAIGAYAVLKYGFHSPLTVDFVKMKLRNPDFHLEPWIYALYIHIVTALLALVIGPFQLFLEPAGMKRRSRHLLLGYTYVLSITISGLVNLFLAWHATGGWVSGHGFFVLDVLWMAATFMAVHKISINDVQAHKEWMLRSYALTFAAVTLRLWLPLLITLNHGSFAPSYQIVAWLCWVPNLIFIKTLIRLRWKRSHRQLNGRSRPMR
ncbi:DUF2306 domain-containing protein [Paenibacillus tyrfis]|uniref:DUF2306 domain-containing protein n=1 Tax=Paenibacillus tyrfis TaxID=1501230 RepID=UPI00068C34CC|nr:DUF2306 domain-containing protein [Paenibacillus tyrfis]